MAKRIHKRPGTKAYQKRVKRSSRRTAINLSKISSDRKIGIMLNKILSEKKTYAAKKSNYLIKISMAMEQSSTELSRTTKKINAQIVDIFSRFEDQPQNRVTLLKQVRSLTQKKLVIIDVLESRDLSVKQKKENESARRQIISDLNNLTKEIKSLSDNNF